MENLFRFKIEIVTLLVGCDLTKMMKQIRRPLFI